MKEGNRASRLALSLTHSLQPIKRPEFYLFCFKGTRQRPQGLPLQDGTESVKRKKKKKKMGGKRGISFHGSVLGETYADMPGVGPLTYGDCLMWSV